MSTLRLGKILAVFSGLLALWALQGCGSGGSGSLNSFPAQPTQVTINALGGTATSGSATLTVPPNAVQTSTTFTVQPATTYPGDSRLIAGTAYDFEAAGALILQPVTVSITFGSLPTNAVESSLTLYNLVNGSWKAVTTSTLNTSTRTVSATVQTLGIFAIFSTQTVSTAGGTVLFSRGLYTASNSVSVMGLDGSHFKNLIVYPANQYTQRAAFAPNGGAIVYDATGGSSSGMVIDAMNADGSNQHKLTGGDFKPDGSQANSYIPAFSADGTTIVFVSDRTGTAEVYTMATDGTNLKQITTQVNSGISHVCFTHAGKIAFYATVNGIGSWYQVNTDGTGLTSVNNTPVNIALVSPWDAYSPDGSTIAAGYQQGGKYDLYLFTPGTGIRSKLTSLNADLIPAARYSSDGIKIIFQVNIGSSQSIYTVNTDGTGLNSLTVSNGPDTLFDVH